MNPQRKILLAILFSAIVFVGVSLFIVWPEIRGVIADANALRAQKQEKNAFLEEQSNLVDFTNFSRQHQKELDAFKNLFVDPHNPVQFLIFVENIAKEFQLAVKLAPGNPTQVKGDIWPSIGFQLSTTAPFLAVRSFLQKLEYAPYALELQNVTIQSMQDTKIPSAVNLQVTLKVYTR